MMHGTWQELIEANYYLCRWPGWKGYLRLNKLPGGAIEYRAHDGSGRVAIGQQDYSRFATRREWQGVEDGTAVL